MRRTSLRVRNLENSPDDWEQKVLLQFESRKELGQPIQEMEFHERITGETGRIFRYMKAIPTGGLCITCHGANLEQNLMKSIDALYPDDDARGYKPGDLRGAFSVKIQLK